MLAGEQGQGSSQPVKNNIVHLQLQALNGANGVLEPVEAAMDDVDIDFDARAKHSDRVGDAIVAVHQKVLANSMDHVVMGRKIDSLGILDDVLHVIFADFPVGRNDRVDAAIVKPAHMAAADAQIDAADFHIGHLFRFDNGVADVFLRQRSINNYAFAHAARACLAQADDIQSALGTEFADDGTDFGGADFQPNNDGRAVKHVSSWFVNLLAAWVGAWGCPWHPAKSREYCP